MQGIVDGVVVVDVGVEVLSGFGMLVCGVVCREVAILGEFWRFGGP